MAGHRAIHQPAGIVEEPWLKTLDPEGSWLSCLAFLVKCICLHIRNKTDGVPSFYVLGSESL